MKYTWCKRIVHGRKKTIEIALNIKIFVFSRSLPDVTAVANCQIWLADSCCNLGDSFVNVFPPERCREERFSSVFHQQAIVDSFLAFLRFRSCQTLVKYSLTLLPINQSVPSPRPESRSLSTVRIVAISRLQKFPPFHSRQKFPFSIPLGRWE